MKKSQTETLKEHVKAVSERLKKSKNGILQQKMEKKKSSNPVSKGKEKRNSKKT